MSSELYDLKYADGAALLGDDSSKLKLFLYIPDDIVGLFVIRFARLECKILLQDWFWSSRT